MDFYGFSPCFPQISMAISPIFSKTEGHTLDPHDPESFGFAFVGTVTGAHGTLVIHGPWVSRGTSLVFG
jgi:hypothetical protein